MNEEALFTLVEAARANTVEAAKQIQAGKAEAADVIPEGFNNNIRWNLGHILTITDQLANYPAGEQPDFAQPYHQAFANGTSPSNWNDETPSLAEIIEGLEAQPAKLKEKFASRVNDPLPKPFTLSGVEYKTVGELLAFNAYHEGLHIGQIGAMIRVIK